MTNIEERVENLVNPIIIELGYELYDVQYSKEGPNYFLRIFIDKPEGIDIDDCEKVSNAINEILDETDYIKEQYFLEVSSPGIERVLRKDKHLKDNIGELIEIHLFKNINDKKIYNGILSNYNEEEVSILEEEKLVQIPRKDISIIKTVYNWE